VGVIGVSDPSPQFGNRCNAFRLDRSINEIGGDMTVIVCFFFLNQYNIIIPTDLLDQMLGFCNNLCTRIDYNRFKWLKSVDLYPQLGCARVERERERERERPRI